MEGTMGLDMYAFTLRRPPATEVDFPIEGAVELHYWRKHPNLHGWMESLYRAKGGKGECFNCATVMLRATDLDRLEDAVRHRRLPHTIGFFFGASDGSEQDDDLLFILNAREAIAIGKTVFYTSWW
jgi:hypothetical protein